MSKEGRGSVLALMSVLSLGVVPAAALAQGTLFVEGERVGIGVENPDSTLHVRKDDGTAKIMVEETSLTTQARELFKLSNNGGPFFIFTNTALARSWAFATLGNNDFTINQQQNAGIQFRFGPTGNLTIAGTLTEGSSRESKTNLATADRHEILARVAGLPVSEWSYIGEENVRHLGPMAEDFFSTFGFGRGEQVLSPRDVASVALVAAQALLGELEAKEARLKEVSAENQSLRSRQAELEDRLDRLESLLSSPARK